MPDRSLTVLALAGGLLISAAGAAVNPGQTPACWPEFRGPDGQGHGTAHDLPVTWSEHKNIAWKTAIPGLGWSTPVIRGEQVWVTTATDKGHSLRAVCLDRTTGKVVHDVEVFAPADPGILQSKNSYASPTPVLEGNRVYVHFGQLGTACLKSTGEVVWRTTLPYKPAYGPGASPVLFDDLLILNCDGVDVRYTVALDKRTGRVRWKKERPGRQSDSTPLIIHTPTGPQLIVHVSERLVSYDPRTGDEIWSISQGTNFAQVPRPVYGHGLLFAVGGYFNPCVVALRPDGHGDVSHTHEVWRVHHASVSLTPSPVLVGDELYLVGDKGQASCFDAATGKLHWRERLGGAFSGSPVFADGKLYFYDEQATTYVLAPGKVFRKLATNRLEGKALASPAVCDRALFLRTDTHLYKIERQ